MRKGDVISQVSFRLRFVATVLIALLYAQTALAESSSKSQSASNHLETVTGTSCYRYGDRETVEQAIYIAKIKAQEEAVRNHRVFIKSSTKLKNFQLEEDVIQAASAAILQNVEQVGKPERKDQEICVTIKAKLSPVPFEQLIDQQTNAKEIANTAQSLMPAKRDFGIKVWTDKPDRPYLEGDRLIIFVTSERDAYIKVDYFQADGIVKHLVPNLFRGQTSIQAGQRYAFGDNNSPEEFIIGPPYGTEAIKVFASDKPFDASLTAEDAVSESRNYLRTLKTRGIEVISRAEGSVALKTTSKTVGDYRAERQAPQRENSKKKP
jgi:hypothetical protein